MKKDKWLRIGVTFCSVLLVFAAAASALDITIYDGASQGTGWYGSQEDQEVETYSRQLERYDLEAMVLIGNQLTLIGQWDFVNGADGWRSGDLFVDVNNDAVYGAPLSGGPNVYDGTPTMLNGLVNYDFVFDVDWDGGTLAYSVMSLDANSVLKTGYFPSTTESNPWRYDSLGRQTAYGGVAQVSGAQSAAAILSTYGIVVTGDLDAHYAATFDVSWLASYNSALFHFTQECNNDNLIGKMQGLPDGGATVALLGITMGALGLFGIRKKR